MKKLIIVIMFILAFSALHAKSRYQDKKPSEELVLSNGARWKVDRPTSINVGRLQQIAKKATGNPLANYQHTGKALQAGINQMIKECRMTGPEHMALHKWLEPLMEHLEQLNRATSAASGRKHYDEVKKRLYIFNRYFRA
jgi:hypothetical protein